MTSAFDHKDLAQALTFATSVAVSTKVAANATKATKRRARKGGGDATKKATARAVRQDEVGGIIGVREGEPAVDSIR